MVFRYSNVVLFFFFFKQKTAYEMRISDWSSDVCSSDLAGLHGPAVHPARLAPGRPARRRRTRPQRGGLQLPGQPHPLHRSSRLGEAGDVSVHAAGDLPFQLTKRTRLNGPVRQSVNWAPGSNPTKPSTHPPTTPHPPPPH